MNDDDYSRLLRVKAEATYDRIERGDSPKPPTKQEAFEKLDSTQRMTEEFACVVFRSNARAIADGSWPLFQIVWWSLARKYHDQLLEVSEGRLTQEEFRKLVIGDAKEERNLACISWQQSTRGRGRPRNRRSDALQKEIVEILSRRMRHWTEIAEKLANNAGPGYVVSSYKGGEFTILDGDKIKTVSYDEIRHRVRRAKEALVKST